MRNNRLRLKSQSSSSYINYSQTNNSISKQSYSFSKSRRFEQHKTECPLTSYDSQCIRKGTGFGMGIGKKFDFTKDLTCSPPSSMYLLKTDFDESLRNRKGFSLGPNRQIIKFANYHNCEVLKTPNSTHYEIKDELCIQKSPSFSMRSRTKILNKLMCIQSLNNFPGPGNINNPEIDRFGNKILQSKRNSGMISKAKRFRTSDNSIPGPATYSQIARFNIKFSQGRRVSQFDSFAKINKQVPGVGSYRVPSEFGQYDDGCSDSGSQSDQLKNICVLKINHKNKVAAQ